VRFGRTSAWLLAIVGVLVFGCSGDGEGSAEESSDSVSTTTQDNSDAEQTAADREADEAIAESALLTLDDFPPGWEAAPANDDEPDSDVLADVADCLGVSEAELDPDNPKATSPTFTSSDDEEVTSEVTLTPSSGDASRALEILKSDAAPGCYAEAIKALVGRNLVASDDVPENVTVGEPTFNRMSFESLGDDSVAFRTTIPVTVESLDVDLYVDFVFVRVGRAGIETTFQSQFAPFDTDEAARLTGVVVDRVSSTGAT